MDFLEKLDYLMEENHLNKNTLSKARNIPYTTIDGWYKKGYEGLKLTSLKKLSGSQDYFFKSAIRSSWHLLHVPVSRVRDRVTAGCLPEYC